MGGGDGLFSTLAVLDPISTGIGYGSSAVATAIDGGTGGWFTELNRTVAPAVGKAAISYQEGGNAATIGTALGTGLATDASRFVAGVSGPVGWVAQGASDTAGYLGATKTIDSDVASYVQLGAGAAGSVYGIGTKMLSSLGTEAVTAAGSSLTGATSAAQTASSAAYGLGPTVTTTSAALPTAATKMASATSPLADTAATTAAQGAGTESSISWDKIGEYASTGLKVGSAGMSLMSGIIGAQSATASAEAEAKRLEGEAELAEGKAELSDLQQIAETNAAAEEKAQLAKRRRALVGKGKTAAAANGVMLETRAESSPAMFEQDAAAELAHEQSKIDYNLRIKNYTHAANAALQRMSAANYRVGASNAKRLGNLNSTSSWIQGIVGAGTTLASAFM